LRESRSRGEVATGLLYLEETGEDMHAYENTVEEPLVDLPFEALCPGSAALEKLQQEWR
jgi:2-oxoglutarate ferredoxin oxidoreductase subunit beta